MVENPKRFGCKNCGADLVFQPGTTSLHCPFCGTQNEIAAEQVAIEELDYNAALQSAGQQAETHEVVAVRCPSCSAETTLPPNVTSQECPYCGTALVASAAASSTRLRPKSLLPFGLDQRKAHQALTKWINALWFAPGSLKSRAERDRALKGVYVPYWTYDSRTVNSYTGERGDYYTENETYTATEGGRSVSKTRQVRKTRWSPASGTFSQDFDDVLVCASRSLPEQYARRLEPWDLPRLVPYQESYLPGFVTETYQVDLRQGFEAARRIMDDAIRETVRSRIGGDEQRIHSVNTRHSNITFKHVLLPVWMGAYRYGGKVYQFLVNARTGEVQGSRPYSWIKITLLVLFIIFVIALLIYFGSK